MLDVTGAEIRIPQKPSQVFLKAIQALAIADPDMPGTEFKEYAEAWRQICHLEELYAAAERKIRWENLLAEWTPTSGEDKKRPGDPSPSAQDDSTPHPSAAPTPSSPLSVGCADISPRRGESSPQGEGLTYDCASAPMPDPDEAKKARSDSARTAAINRKRNLLEKLDGLRAEGVTLAAIAAAAPGLTIIDVMDALARKPLALMKQQALERAVKKLEEAGQDGG